MKHLNITEKGVVQGVFFRASTNDQADQLAYAGWSEMSRTAAPTSKPRVKIFSWIFF